MNITLDIMLGIFGLCVTLVCCTWKLCTTISNLVSDENCSKRRKECPCHREIEVIKKEIF